MDREILLKNQAKLIKIALIQKGITQAALARDLCVTRQAVNRIINNSADSARVKAYISEKLGIIWS